MVETCGEARLRQHPLAEALVVGEALAQQLQRNRPFEACVEGPIDVAHAAAADEIADLVPRNDVSRPDPPAYRHMPSSRS